MNCNCKSSVKYTRLTDNKKTVGMCFSGVNVR